MNLYIVAEFPFALRVDGKTAYKNVNRCFLAAPRGALAEVIPLDGSPARCFMADCDFLRTGAEDAVKVRWKNGGAVKFERPAPDLPFSLLFQKRLKNAVLTAYADGRYKFSVEVPEHYRALSFKEPVADAGEFFFGGNRFFYVYTEKKRLVCLEDGRLATVFDGAADEYSFSSGAFVTKSALGGTPRVLRTEWEYGGAAFTPRRTETEGAAARRPLCDAALPYAFAEAVLAGEDPAPYLAPDLLPAARRAREYLGRFIGVFPPPRRENDPRPLLVYPESEGVYAAKTLQCEISGGKIANLTLI